MLALIIKRAASLLDIVPGWCWALALAGLAAWCAHVSTGREHARLDAQIARAQLAALELASQAAVKEQIRQARVRELALAAEIEEITHAVQTARSAEAAAAAAGDERLRKLARPVTVCPHRADTDEGATATASAGGDGPGPAGLLGLDRAGVVVLDDQAWADLAAVGASANTAAAALRQCVAGWKSAHKATAQ